MGRYEDAKRRYEVLGVDTDRAIDSMKKISLSMHCWQGDDVKGYDSSEAMSGGIQATGNYPGRARTAQELMSDMDKALSLVPGKHRINLHASYAVFSEGEHSDRDALKPQHFEAWLQYAKERDLGIDFNPTMFSHEKASSLTLTHPDKEIRDFWIRHCKACIKISEYFAENLGKPSMMNIWIPDGLKDNPGNRMILRKRFKESLDEILSMPYDKEKVYVSLESKVFGIGLESYTVGSSEFCMNYVSERKKDNLMILMDNGHYHPTEKVSDKVSSMLLFNDRIGLHLTRSVRWDSDHVVLQDEETLEICKEIVRSDALERVFVGLDFFDASINRVAAWVIGMRTVMKSMLIALLEPVKLVSDLQESGDYTRLMATLEELKNMPANDVWEKFLKSYSIESGMGWYEEVMDYEANVLKERE